MDDLTRKIIVGYCIAVMLVVLIVPWVQNVPIESYRGVKLHEGYRIIFSPPTAISSIDYGRVVLEFIGITAVALICYIMRDKLKK